MLKSEMVTVYNQIAERVATLICVSFSKISILILFLLMINLVGAGTLTLNTISPAPVVLSQSKLLLTSMTDLPE